MEIATLLTATRDVITHWLVHSSVVWKIYIVTISLFIIITGNTVCMRSSNDKSNDSQNDSVDCGDYANASSNLL